MPDSKIDTKRHSFAHIMAMAVKHYNKDAKLGIGPVIENGFYYDFDLKNKLVADDLKNIETMMKSLIKADLKFEKKFISFPEAKKLFRNEPYKLELIKELNKNKQKISIYKTFDKQSKNVFIDLCAGPHIKSTKELNPDAFKLMSIAGAYWRGSEKKPQLQRIYGVAFNTKKEFDEYLKKLEQAQKCDHRNLNDRLELFMIDEEIGKGLPLWLPNGYFIRHKLEEYIYKIEAENGYLHVLTPHIAREELYKKSGHLTHYREDMYSPIEIDEENYYLKPMNCPHHHSIYKYHKRSYRELPLRIAEFGTVYRYERSGVLSGLVRLRGFTQNDAHIYLNEENLEKEIIAVLKLHKKVFDDFKINDYWYRLSLPDFKNKEKYGDIKNKKIWERGAKILKQALLDLKYDFVETKGEATFYGPKIDIQTKDLYGKEDTIATIQVDYYSAPRFNLFYVDKDGKEKPIIIIHRAIFGSFDRFFAFLIEKTCGNLPLWIVPVQIKILAVSDKQKSYAEKILKSLQEKNIRVALAETNETLGKRIREAELQKIPYIIIVGDKEIQNNTINVRDSRANKQSEESLEEFIKKIVILNN